MDDKRLIYICGHQFPDTDSVVSAIAYAHLKQRKGINAVACRLGPINAETAFVLERFGIRKPILLKDARATLEEIEMDDVVSVRIHTTIKEAMELMSETGTRTLAVVNEKNQLLGVVTNSNLAYVAIGDTAHTIKMLQQTPVENIAKSIEGKIVYAPLDFKFNGKVSIVAIASTKLQNYELSGRLVVIGNDTDSQIEAINRGAACIVTVWTKEIAPEVIEMAKEHNCAIIMSEHGSLNTSRYIFFAPSVDKVMSSDPIYFNKSEFIDDAADRMLKTRYRSYPVVDDQNRIYGFVSRFHVLNSKNKRVILVDHNEYSQSVVGIEEAEVLEVIDHHRIGDVSTAKPIYFRNEIIGSTASIVAKMYEEAGEQIPKDIAGLLLAAMISDTLNLKSPTTTPQDLKIAEKLCQISEINRDDFAREMFEITSSIGNKSYEEIINQDIKSFNLSGHNVVIGQVVVYEFDEVNNILDEFTDAMDQYVKVNKIDLLTIVFTSIVDNGSIILAAGEMKKAVHDAFPNREGERYSFFSDVVSRKNQIVPKLSYALSQYKTSK
ncbi:inorganic pyrophosphatase [Erysipelothrix larvae]|uniref:inorganic diphosphatase n=1 Tax=Erysipelothrix larvae TaxID=1514105 RepID=A0A0X8GZ81_9FIRM|nr:putative manganese-dependent inorganic diphosphatase [Erysipelothrix larvae]AMC93158.1 inorganic pyrophosphatase [Erysipelothrix larvae]